MKIKFLRVIIGYMLFLHLHVNDTHLFPRLKANIRLYVIIRWVLLLSFHRYPVPFRLQT